jgi:branched-chain amino acid transport system substrate-binding protein
MRKFVSFALSTAVLAAAAMPGSGAGAQEAPKSIKIGYVISLSGPQSAGAMLTTVPNYRLWVDEVNKAGGLMLKKYNKRIPIEVTEIDDRSNNEDMVRLVERLMTVDKVDIVLSPWGTGPNLQAAPVFAKNGYPQLVGTGNSDKIPELVQRFPSTFWFLGMPSDGANALVDTLAALKQKGQINDKVALFVVQHPFGSEFVTPTKPLLEKAGFKLVYDTTYPLGISDLSAQIKAAKAAGPDTMIAFSYPPDTFMLTEQAATNDFNPKVKFLGVGVAFPNYKGKFGDKVNGIFGLGAWNPDGPGVKDWFARHKALTNQEPDRWASSNTYASLQVLQQAIEQVGEIDRPKIIEAIKIGSFKTILGDTKLEAGVLRKVWWVGQWQDGEYRGIAPATLPGASQPKLQ